MHEFMTVPMSPGEVLDRITILNLKAERIKIQPALSNVRQELRMLKTVWDSSEYSHLNVQAELDGLLMVNAQLWDVEDRLREMENRAEFGDEFVQTARSVYRLNDQRATIKHTVNHRLGSRLTEEKSYLVNGSEAS